MYLLPQLAQLQVPGCLCLPLQKPHRHYGCQLLPAIREGWLMTYDIWLLGLQSVRCPPIQALSD